MKNDFNDLEALVKLKKRVERVLSFYAQNAPDVIKTTELQLIKSSCDELLEELLNKGE